MRGGGDHLFLLVVIIRLDHTRCAGFGGRDNAASCCGRGGRRSCRGAKGRGVGERKIWMTSLRCACVLSKTKPWIHCWLDAAASVSCQGRLAWLSSIMAPDVDPKEKRRRQRHGKSQLTWSKDEGDLTVRSVEKVRRRVAWCWRSCHPLKKCGHKLEAAGMC